MLALPRAFFMLCLRCSSASLRADPSEWDAELRPKKIVGGLQLGRWFGPLVGGSLRQGWHRGRAVSTLRPTCFGLATSLFSSPGDSMATAAVAQQVAAAAGAHSSMEDTLDEAASNGDCQTEGNDEHMALPPARGVAVLKQGWLHKLSYRYKFRSGDCSSTPSDPRTHLLYHAARVLASAFSHALPLTLGSLFLPGGKGGRSATWR